MPKSAEKFALTSNQIARQYVEIVGVNVQRNERFPSFGKWLPLKLINAVHLDKSDGAQASKRKRAEREPAVKNLCQIPLKKPLPAPFRMLARTVLTINGSFQDRTAVQDQIAPL